MSQPGGREYDASTAPGSIAPAEGAARRLAEGDVLAGRYRILGRLGAGGMGMVYQAEDRQLGLTVAIKVLRPELAGDEVWIGRFKHELLLARQVSHPNVVRIHDIGTDGDLAFLTMDRVAGRSLADLLVEEKRLAPARAAEIARQIALALDAAHQAGVIHRDIKPSNVLIDESRGSLRVALSDFGIARSLSSSGATLPGTVVGTLGYLSPEQARGEALDGRSDLYALGILLYEMLTGALPFRDGTAAEALVQRSSGALPRLKWPEDVPFPLRSLVERLLARDPARRPPGAGEIARELASPRTPRRRWRWMAAAAGALLLAVLGLALQRHALPARPGPGAAGPAAAPRQAVALLPLADGTGRADLAWLATGMPEMLATALAESPRLRVLDSGRVFAALDDLKLPRGPLPDADARRLASLLDIDHLIAGRVYAADGRLRVDLSLLATDPPGTPSAALRAEAGEGEAFRLIEQLGGVLRQRLAAPVEVAGPLAPSRSTAALAAGAEGAASLQRGDALSAVLELRKAVAADPLYTAAWVRLARAQQSLGHDREAREAARRAVATVGAGESHAAYEARAVEARLLGRPQRAQEILERLVSRYPGDVEARVLLAEAYGEQGSLDRAIAALREVVSREPHHPRAWFLLGKYAILAGDARRAVDEPLVRALVVQNELGNRQGRAEVLNAFGVAYRKLGEMDRAAESFEAAADLRRRIGDRRGYATTLRNLADLQMLRGEQKAAEARLEEATAILEALGDRAGLADLQNDFGVLAEQRGDYAAALERYQKALRLRRDLGNDLALAQSCGNVGYACFLLGRYDEAAVYWRQQLELARKSADRNGEVLATQSLGQLQLARGDWTEAARSLLTALQESRETGMKEALPVSLVYLGRLHQYQGRPAAALASYDEALKVLREIGDRQGLAEVHLAAAETHLQLGMADAAADRLRQAAEVLAGGSNRAQRAELDRLRGELLLYRGERRAAAAAWRRSVAEAVDSQDVAQILSSRLSAARLGPAGPGGLAALQERADALGNAPLRLRAAEEVAVAALAAGDGSKAAAAAQSGLELADDSGGYAGAYRLHQLLAAALERQGQSSAAAAQRRLAGEEIARLGRGLPPGSRQSFHRMLEAQNEDEPKEAVGRVERGPLPPSF